MSVPIGFHSCRPDIIENHIDMSSRIDMISCKRGNYFVFVYVDDIVKTFLFKKLLVEKFGTKAFIISGKARDG
jgi:hypothetical protein